MSSWILWPVVVLLWILASATLAFLAGREAYYRGKADGRRECEWNHHNLNPRPRDRRTH